MNFSEQELDAIWSIISAILFIGNLKFDDKEYDVNNACEIVNEEILEKVAILLEISKVHLSKAILYKTRVIDKQVRFLC